MFIKPNLRLCGNPVAFLLEGVNIAGNSGGQSSALSAEIEVVVRDVTFQYPNTSAPQLEGFNLDVARGSCVALLGPSGCAKTTVLRLIAGLEKPKLGTISIAGKDVVRSGFFLPPQSREVGLVFQDYALFPHLTVGKNIAYGLHQFRSTQRSARVKQMLELVKMSDYERKYPHQLSGGQAQRVALARALAPEPKVLLLDEPFSHLDADLRESVREEVQQILDNTGVTAILVTHDEDDAHQLADTIVRMEAPAEDK